jgi:hypothetical protein
MGLPIRELHVTNTGSETGHIILTKWIPVKKDDGRYCWPPNTPLGFDMWIPNVLGLKEEEGTVSVKIVESKKETGLWLICFNDYFGDEQHLYANHKPIHEDEEYNSLHVSTDIKMEAGDGPIPVTLERI